MSNAYKDGFYVYVAIICIAVFAIIAGAVVHDANTAKASWNQLNSDLWENVGRGVWAKCDRGNRIYLLERDGGPGVALAVTPNGCND